MTRPQNRQQAAAAVAAMSGAVDLAGLKERADAQRAAAARPAASPQGPAAGGPPPAAGGVPAAAGDLIVDVTEATFESEVIVRSSERLVVVDLAAQWSPPSQQLTPVLESLAARSGGQFILAKVDVDANPRIAQAFRAQSIPMIIAIAQGQPVAAFTEVRSEAEIATWIAEILSQVGRTFTGGAQAEPDAPRDERMVAAEEKMNAGDFDGALADYRAIAEAEPDNLEAASLVRNIEFMLRAQAHDPSIVQTAAPGDVDAQLAAADVLLLGQQPEEAFDRIIAVVKATGGDDRTTARTRLLELFELFDPAEPFVVSARRKLASALY